MIIIINSNGSTGKSTFAQALAKSIFPQTPQVIEGIPTEEPGWLGQMTIYTWQYGTDLPAWIIERDDYTVINISRLKEELPNDWSTFENKDIQVGGLNFSLFEPKNNG